MSLRMQNTAGVENDGIICVCIPFIELTPSRRQTDLREQFSTISQIDGEDALSILLCIVGYIGSKTRLFRSTLLHRVGFMEYIIQSIKNFCFYIQFYISIFWSYI